MRKQHCSSKSFSKSPNFESLKKNLKFKTQKCRTSAKVKQAIQFLPGQRRLPKNQRQLLGRGLQKQSQTTFESQKVFSTVVPSVDIYMSPARIKSLADPQLSQPKLNSSLKARPNPSPIRHATRAGKGKLHQSENLDQESATLGNFKSLDQLKLPKNLLDCKSFNSQQNIKIDFFKKSRGPSRRKHGAVKPGDKYSFFKAYSTNKPRPCSWKKKNCVFPAKKRTVFGAVCQNKARQRTTSKNKPVKLGLFQKVFVTRPARTRRTPRYST